ncbi:MAG: hypothetical protein FWJ85_08920 [Solitalea sp.]
MTLAAILWGSFFGLVIRRRRVVLLGRRFLLGLFATGLFLFDAFLFDALLLLAGMHGASGNFARNQKETE